MIASHQPRRCALELEALPCRVAQVRRIVSAQLRHWELDQFLDPVLLGVSELLANVHRHAEPDKHCAIEISFVEGLLTVSVADHDPRPPKAGPRADLFATGGRGLAILDALTDSWGSRPAADGPGKVVWFALGGAAAPDPAPALAAEAGPAPLAGPLGPGAGPPVVVQPA